MEIVFAGPLEKQIAAPDARLRGMTNAGFTV